jgi:hypothetical protein
VKSIGDQEEAGEAQHGLVNPDHVESEANFTWRNEVSRRFLGVIQLQNRISIDDGEPQRPRRCPEVTSLPNSRTLCQKGSTCGSETG